MQLDLTDVLSGPGASVEKPIEIPAGSLDEWELAAPVTGWVRASNARRNIVVRGEANIVVKLQCGRCLQDFEQPMRLKLDVVVPLQTFNNLLGAAAVSEEEDDSGDELTAADIAALFHEHALDVSELIRQGIVLQAPIAPVCSDDCPGLPEATQYRVVEGDPRWAALQQLQQGSKAPQQNNGRGPSNNGAGLE